MPHTPGPWKAEVESHRVKIAGSDNYYIAVLGAENDYREKQLANAQLIAAAPDLLAACHIVLTHIKVGPGSEFSLALALEMCKKAITKAEGE